jgi:hypothetical protein
MSAVVSSYPDSSQSSIEDSNLSLAMNSYGSLVSLMRSMVGSEMQYKKCKETSHVIQFSIDEKLRSSRNTHHANRSSTNSSERATSVFCERMGEECPTQKSTHVEQPVVNSTFNMVAHTTHRAATTKNSTAVLDYTAWYTMPCRFFITETRKTKQHPPPHPPHIRSDTRHITACTERVLSTISKLQGLQDKYKRDLEDLDPEDGNRPRGKNVRLNILINRSTSCLRQWQRIKIEHVKI